jgi:hypothetical protein
MFINKKNSKKSRDTVPLRGPFTSEAVENTQKHDQYIAPSFFVNRRKRHKTALKDVFYIIIYSHKRTGKNTIQMRGSKRGDKRST